MHAEQIKEGSQANVMTFWDHTEELARRLKVALYAFFISIIVTLILPSDLSFLNNPLEYYQPLAALILRRIRDDIFPLNAKLIGLEMIDPIQLYVMASFIFALSIPITAYEIYKFVNRALYPNEKKDVYPFLVSFSALSITGLAFGYKILTPFMIGAEMVVSIIDFYTLVFIAVLASGLSFILPVFLLALVKSRHQGCEE